MATEPLVTIAIPTFNRADAYLPTTLAAASRQTYANLDILVADNASADDTEKVVASFRDRRIRYHKHPTNVGAAANWNFCVDQGRGKYFLMLMDDDLIDADFVETCIKRVAERPEAGLIRTGTRVVDGHGNLIHISPNYVDGLDFTDFLLAWMDGNTAPYLCSTLFRTEPLQRIGIHSKHYLWSDLMSELQIASEHGRIDIPEVKASFRVHQNELTSKTKIKSWCEDAHQLLEMMCELTPAARRDLIRERGLEFMAMFNYRIALRLHGSWPDRARACVEVHRAMQRRPHVRRLLLELAKHSRAMNSLRSWRYRSHLANANAG